MTTIGTPTPTVSEGGILSGISFIPNSNGTATLSGTPAIGTRGTYPITITARNSTGASVTQNAQITVDSPNQSVPMITSANHTTFWFYCDLFTKVCTGIPNSFTVTTTGSPTPALTAVSYPSGAALPPGEFTDNHNGTATLFLKPTATGTTKLKITATGLGGATFAAVQIFTLNIQQLPGAPSFTSPDQVVFSVGLANSFTVAASPAVDSITESGTLPTGVSFVDNHDGTATLSGTPTTPVPP